MIATAPKRALPGRKGQSRARPDLKPKLALAQDKPAPRPPSPLERLVAVQGELMRCTDRISLLHAALNHAGTVVPVGHAVWVDRRGRLRVLGISAQERFDRNTPFAQWLEGTLSGWAGQHRLDAPHSATLEARRSTDAFSYPFTSAHYAPFAPKAAAGGLLFTRDTPFSETETALLDRLAATTGVVDAALRGRKRARLSGRKRVWFWAITAALGAASMIPVPLTALVPAEVVPTEPSALSAPIDGVIDEVLVQPGTQVSEGELLARMDSTDFRNELTLATEALNVAEARLRQTSLTSFTDEATRRELAVGQAEADLARARLAHARDRLARSELRAPRDGVALFSSVSDWEGRPVATGEAILRIADPARVRLRVHAPLAHGEALRGGARVRFFLDSDPITPIEAVMTRIDLEPVQQPEGGVAYQAEAELSGDALPRIGARGVAKVYGDTAPLGYFIIRRPLTLARQWTGL